MWTVWRADSGRERSLDADRTLAELGQIRKGNNFLLELRREKSDLSKAPAAGFWVDEGALDGGTPKVPF
jgi:hypothetical protein